MHTTLISSQSFGWNYKTHIEITEMALQNDNRLDKVEKRMLGRFSQMPDFCKEELGDLNSSHFFFPYGKKKSFTLKKDSENNAFDKFKYHVNNALKEAKSVMLFIIYRIFLLLSTRNRAESYRSF